jgi:hypothetical protein
MSLVRRLLDLKHSAAGLYGLQRLGGLDRSPGKRPLACNFSLQISLAVEESCRQADCRVSQLDYIGSMTPIAEFPWPF